MDNNYTHILFILDNSASMGSLKEDAIGGYNEFLKEQQKLDGKCKLDTLLFSEPDKYRYVQRDADINSVKELTNDIYTANGWSTALIDAIGRGINDLGEFLDTLDEDDKPAKVLVNIFTDGQENSSQEFTGQQVKKMIAEQENKYSWAFAFLASDLSSANYAKNHLGISNVAKTDNDGKGMRSMYSSVNENARSYRATGMTLSVQDAYDNARNEEDEEKD